jgi:hypothetical protein
MDDLARYRAFLHVIGTFIKEDALQAKKDADESSDSDRLFHRGKLHGYYAVISTLQQHATPQGIPLEELELDDIVPDRDLL